MKYNFHTHSHYDDGSLAMEDFVVAAIDQGFDALGFSGHSPMPIENEWSIKLKDLPAYAANGKRLKEQYKDQIRLYLGLEIDFIPGLSDDFDSFRKGIPLDYCIGSVHLVRHPDNGQIWFIDGPAEHFFQGLEAIYHGDIRAAVTAFYEQSMMMVASQSFEIIGHLDKVKMHANGNSLDTTERWYQELTGKLLKTIKQKDIIVELNTRGVYMGKTNEYFPSESILEHCLHLGIPVMVNSDAHHPDQLSNQVAEAVGLLKDIGFKEINTPFHKQIQLT
jgi:histidinol-phosphatase (PHP family)